MKLTVVITAHNSQDFIKDCLKSVEFADEVIVINNQSTDDTAKISKKLGAKIIDHKNNPKQLNESKNFGFKKAQNEWILSLDTDERVDEDLQKEIQYILEHSQDIKVNGYLIPRKNIIFGKWIQHGLWYPDYQLRLFRKGKGSFPNLHNHELLEVKGEVGRLKGHITHLNYQTISQYIQKIDKQYTDNEAEQFIKKGNTLHWYDAIRFPFQDFLTNYFAREAYKDGLHGLVLSLLQAFYMFIVFAKIWEHQGFKQQDIQLNQTKPEVKRMHRQLKHWYLHETKKTSNFTKKIILKFLSFF